MRTKLQISCGLLILSIIFANLGFSASNGCLGDLLNKISLPLQAKEWLTTKTGLVRVTIDAAINDQNIGRLQEDALGKLKILVPKGDWHIISFNRSLSQSGLETVTISAEARLAQAELVGLRNKVKEMSKPGLTLNIDNIAFTPSDEEIQAANIKLRNNIYQQAKTEIAELNKLYPDQNYYLYSLDFTDNSIVTYESANQAVPVTAVMKVSGVHRTTAFGRSADNLNIGNKLTLNATLRIAAMPAILARKVNNAVPE